MDVVAETRRVEREPSGAIHVPPETPRAIRWFAVAPADVTRVVRWIEPVQPTCASGLSIVVVDAMATLPVPALAGIRAFLGRHSGPSAVVVDRMDDAGCEYGVFDARRRRLTDAGVSPDLFIPALSSTGEGIASGPDRIDWHRGPTLAEWLASLAMRPSLQRPGSLP